MQTVKLFLISRKKAELFNLHFAPQCTPINNSSVYPRLECITNERLASVKIKKVDIYLIIKNVNTEKARVWDEISIRMIELHWKATVEPLQVLFLSFFEDDVYPDDLKKSNVVPIYKKESKNLIRNYRSISLLPVFSKVFGKIIFNSLPNSFLENKLLTECQSGFLPGDSYISQLFFISPEIYKSFDCNPSLDVRGTF